MNEIAQMSVMCNGSSIHGQERYSVQSRRSKVDSTQWRFAAPKTLAYHPIRYRVDGFELCGNRPCSSALDKESVGVL